MDSIRDRVCNKENIWILAMNNKVTRGCICCPQAALPHTNIKKDGLILFVSEGLSTQPELPLATRHRSGSSSVGEGDKSCKGLVPRHCFAGWLLSSLLGCCAVYIALLPLDLLLLLPLRAAPSFCRAACRRCSCFSVSLLSLPLYCPCCC